MQLIMHFNYWKLLTKHFSIKPHPERIYLFSLGAANVLFMEQLLGRCKL